MGIIFKDGLTCDEKDFDSLKKLISDEETFNSNVQKVVAMTQKLKKEIGEYDLKLVMALYTFDMENAESPYSQQLKLSIYNHDCLNPLSFFERLEELCQLKVHDFSMYELAIQAALELHKSRIISGCFGELPEMDE